MLRVVEIIDNNNFSLLCKFNTGEVKKLNVLPIIENHKHLNGIDRLYDNKEFAKVKIGEFGEIFWSGIVHSNQDGQEFLWDYDISPEYAYFNSQA